MDWRSFMGKARHCRRLGLLLGGMSKVGLAVAWRSTSTSASTVVYKTQHLAGFG